jgi:glutamate carboxypeptidase
MVNSQFDVRAALHDVETRTPQFLRDLGDLVAIDSGTYDRDGASKVAARRAERYRSLGGTVETHRGSDFGDVVVATFEGSGTGKVLLLGHTDTVYPAGTAGLRPLRIDGERAIGPGTADMKAGDLSIVYALEAIWKQGWEGFGRIEVVHNADEEVGSPDSRDLVRERSEDTDAVLVLEAGRENGCVVSARKGIAACRLEIVGRPAHAGVNHHHGRSAVLELAHMIIALEGINGAIPGVSVNVGRIEGGDRVNVVPDRAMARLELRAPRREELLAGVERVRRLVEQRTVEDTDATIEVDIEHYPMQKTERSARLLHRAQVVARDLGFEIEDTATGGASDGNTAAAAGAPVLDGLGPIGGSAHSPDEYVWIPSIAPRIALLAGLIVAVGLGPVDD